MSFLRLYRKQPKGSERDAEEEENSRDNKVSVAYSAVK